MESKVTLSSTSLRPDWTTRSKTNKLVLNPYLGNLKIPLHPSKFKVTSKQNSSQANKMLTQAGVTSTQHWMAETSSFQAQLNVLLPRRLPLFFSSILSSLDQSFPPLPLAEVGELCI